MSGYLSEGLPVQEITEPLCPVPLDDALPASLAAELVHILQEETGGGREGEREGREREGGRREEWREGGREGERERGRKREQGRERET